jgi:transposase
MKEGFPLGVGGKVELRLINPLNPELNPICYLLALLGTHHFSTLAG